MFRQLLLAVSIASLTLAGSSRGHCHDELEPGTAAESPSVQPRSDATRLAEGLLDQIVSWLASNFDLPAIKDRPAIKFASKMKLAMMTAHDRAHFQGLSQAEAVVAQRQVVALYDNASKAIFLPDDWIGTSPVDQSVLVHEMVHHIQNVAQLKFECPMARERLAYLAQDKWLGRFGMSLEREFDVDMFTVLISSACVY